MLYRKPSNFTDSDGETDLQGLVSNILDEAVSQNGYDERYGIKVFILGEVVQMACKKLRQ